MGWMVWQIPEGAEADRFIIPVVPVVTAVAVI